MGCTNEGKGDKRVGTRYDKLNLHIDSIDICNCLHKEHPSIEEIVDEVTRLGVKPTHNWKVRTTYFSAVLKWGAHTVSIL